VIVEWLLAMFQTVILWALAPLPSDPFDVMTHINTLGSNLGALNYFLPIVETVTLVVAVFALFPVFLGVTLALWVAAQLRGSSSVG